MTSPPEDASPSVPRRSVDLVSGEILGIHLPDKRRQMLPVERLSDTPSGQGLLEVCPSRSGPAVAPAVAFAGTAFPLWPPSPPPRLLLQVI